MNCIVDDNNNNNGVVGGGGDRGNKCQGGSSKFPQLTCSWKFHWLGSVVWWWWKWCWCSSWGSDFGGCAASVAVATSWPQQLFQRLHPSLPCCHCHNLCISWSWSCHCISESDLMKMHNRTLFQSWECVRVDDYTWTFINRRLSVVVLISLGNHTNCDLLESEIGIVLIRCAPLK